MIRIEIMDDKKGIYIAIQPDGIVSKSTEIDETVTADWDAQGRLIGVEVAIVNKDAE